VSPPLREIPAISEHVGEPKVEIPLRLIHPNEVKPSQDDPVLQHSIGTGIATTPGLGFDGVGVSRYAPSDANGATGLTQYFQWVNVQFAVFDKATGAILYGPAAGKTLWSGFGGPCETNNDGDPVAQYDKAANRWVLSQFAVTGGPPYYQCVAVSTTPDATGPYARYAFQYSTFNDYGKIGVWPDGYYASFNMFQGNTFVGSKVCAYDRTAMLAGVLATQQCFQLGSAYGGLLPSDLDGTIAPPPGSPNFFVAFGTNSLRLWRFHTDWTTPANTTLTGPITIPVAAFTMACNGGACIPQSGTTQKLDSLGDRLMYRLAYRRFSDGHEAIVANHSVAASNGVVGVRWYELRDPNGTPVIYQQGTFAPDSTYRWMGSIAMDSAGNIGLGYSVSSGAIHPGIRFTGRAPSDSLGFLGSEISILEGTGSQTKTLARWGDYTSLAVDPTDDCTLWYTNQYLKSNGTFNWSTRIDSFKFTSCPASGGGGQQTLTVSKAGSTGTGTVTSSPAGISCGATCSATYTSGAQVTLTAVADSGSTFAGWSGGGCSGTGTCTVTLSADTTVTATFNTQPVQQFTLTAAKNGTGTGTVTSSPAGISCGATCSASYASGAQVTLTAVADSGSIFAGWSGSGCSGTGTCVVTLSANTTATATFNTQTTQQFTLTVSKSGNGTVTSSPAGISCGATCSATYASGTPVTLTAVAGGNSTFTGWGGACTGIGTCTVTMNSNTTVTATFNNKRK
jgi:hypothetical protein